MNNKQMVSPMEAGLAEFLRGKMRRLRASYTLAFEAGWVAHGSAAQRVDELEFELAKFRGMNHNQILAESAANHMVRSGAKNYTGAVFTITLDSDGEQFEVTVTTQKVGAQTPHELRIAAERRVELLDRLLLQTNELLYAIQSDPGAVPSSAIDAMRGDVFAALKNATEGAPVCNHEWTDDGEYLLVCTACGAKETHNPGWRDMATAPRDGSMLRLLVEFENHSTEDADQAPTIGANNFDNDGEDHWRFAGWCWTHDHFVEGKGTPVGWLPMLDSKTTEGLSHE